MRANTSNFKIFDADQSHADSVASVHVQAWRETYAGKMPASYLDALDPHKRATSWLALIREKKAGHGIRIAAVEGHVVGLVSFGPWRGAGLDQAGEIYALYLLARWQGAGIGHALLRSALESMDQSNKIGLWVLDSNSNAIKFYKKAGFRDIGVRKGLDIGGAPLMEIMMVKERA